MRLLDKGHAYVKRYREIADVMLRHGFGYLLERLGIRPFRSLRERLFGPSFKEHLLILSEAERLRLALEELGPTFIKFGQILSTRSDIVPEEYIRELSKLQDRVPPFSYQESRGMIEKELGKSLDETFISFDPEPIAAASIGQVHRARLLGGEEVAVKVMRPGIEELVETDLFIMMRLAKFAEKHIKESKFFNPVGFVDEFSRVMRLELDYTHEAQNEDRFYLNFAGSATIRIPKVYWNYTTKRVLTMEFLEGIKISEIKKLEESGLDKKKITVDLANAYLKMIFEDGFYHADPHPGNILVSKEGFIVFLDFGMAEFLNPALRENLANLLIAIKRNDTDFFIETLTEMGFVGEIEEGSILKIQIEEYMSKYYSLPSKFIDPTQFLGDLVQVITKSRGKIPTNIMILSKTLYIRNDISRRLNPEHNFAELADPYIKKIIEERISPAYRIKETTKIVQDYAHLVKGFPRRFGHILTKVEKGKMKIEVEHPDFEIIVDELDVTTNRLSFSIIISALIVGSSLIIQTGMSPRFLGVPLLGLFGFFIAGFIGFWLLFSILRSGKW